MGAFKENKLSFIVNTIYTFTLKFGKCRKSPMLNSCNFLASLTLIFADPKFFKFHTYYANLQSPKLILAEEQWGADQQWSKQWRWPNVKSLPHIMHRRIQTYYCTFNIKKNKTQVLFAMVNFFIFLYVFCRPHQRRSYNCLCWANYGSKGHPTLFLYRQPMVLFLKPFSLWKLTLYMSIMRSF